MVLGRPAAPSSAELRFYLFNVPRLVPSQLRGRCGYTPYANRLNCWRKLNFPASKPISFDITAEEISLY